MAAKESTTDARSRTRTLILSGDMAKRLGRSFRQRMASGSPFLMIKMSGSCAVPPFEAKPFFCDRDER